MDNKKIIIGHHISKGGHRMDEAIELATAQVAKHGVKLGALQLFAVGPLAVKDNLSEAEMLAIGALHGPIKIIHGSYFDNPWGSKPYLAKKIIKREFEIGQAIGAKGLVIHLAKKPPNEIAAIIPELLGLRGSTNQTILYLEIESYKPNEGTYETPAKIKALFDLIEPSIRPHIGLCIDTAHLWAANVNVRTAISPDEANEGLDMAQWLANLPPIEHVMVHLNDQIWPKGSGRDEHAPLAYGTIWSEDKSGLITIIQHSINNQWPIILERKEDKPKIHGRPLISNIDSDYITLADLGFLEP
jgi:endonuclease IV